MATITYLELDVCMCPTARLYTATLFFHLLPKKKTLLKCADNNYVHLCSIVLLKNKVTVSLRLPVSSVRNSLIVCVRVHACV